MFETFEKYEFGPIPMLVLAFMLGLLLIIPFWKLFSRVGYSGLVELIDDLAVRAPDRAIRPSVLRLACTSTTELMT